MAQADYIEKTVRGTWRKSLFEKNKLSFPFDIY